MSLLCFWIRLEPFLFHLPQDVAHIIDFVPHILAHIDGRFLLDRHGDAVARTSVQFDNFLLMQLVFGANNQPCIISRILQVVNDHTLDMCAKGSHEMGDKIVCEGALLGNLAHEHRDRTSDGLIDINDEHLVVIAQENCASAAGRQNRTHLNLDHRLVHK